MCVCVCVCVCVCMYVLILFKHNYSCQNINRFLFFCIVYHKTKTLNKIYKIYKYTYIKRIFIINFEYI